MIGADRRIPKVLTGYEDGCAPHPRSIPFGTEKLLKVPAPHLKVPIILKTVVFSPVGRPPFDHGKTFLLHRSRIMIVKQTLIFLFLLAAGLPAASQEFPPAVSDLISRIGLEDTHWHPGQKRADLEGRLRDTWVEINFHRGGALEEIEAEHDGLFPASAIAAVVPDALKSSLDYPSDAEFEKIKFGREEYQIEGRTADGHWFEAEFDGSGHLRKWDRK